MTHLKINLSSCSERAKLCIPCLSHDYYAKEPKHQYKFIFSQARRHSRPGRAFALFVLGLKVCILGLRGYGRAHGIKPAYVHHVGVIVGFFEWVPAQAPWLSNM